MEHSVPRLLCHRIHCRTSSASSDTKKSDGDDAEGETGERQSRVDCSPLSDNFIALDTRNGSVANCARRTREAIVTDAFSIEEVSVDALLNGAWSTEKTLTES